MKIDQADLTAKVIEAKKSGVLTNELASIAMQIAKSYIFSDRKNSFTKEQREDILGKWTVLFVEKWERMDPERNCFSWIVSTVRSTQYVYTKSYQRRLEREHAKANDEYFERMDSVRNFIRKY